MLDTQRKKAKSISPIIKQAFSRSLTATTDLLLLSGRRGLPEMPEQRFSAWLATTRRDVMRAQRLRFEIFSREYGARMHTPFGLDRDKFDKHCRHLLVRDNQNGKLVGYTRILTQEGRRKTGGFYSQSEFEMARITRLPGSVAELGRTCIHPDYRNGAVISVLWARLAQLMLEQDISYLVGCASVALNEGYDLGQICSKVREEYLADENCRVMPRIPVVVPSGSADCRNKVRMPPLLKAYLRMGARVCGEPCLDEDFNCADFFVMLAVDDLPARYVQHFLQPAMQA